MTNEQIRATRLTEKEAKALIRKHKRYWSDFIEDCGKAQFYSGALILDWIGV